MRAKLGVSLSFVLVMGCATAPPTEQQLAAVQIGAPPADPEPAIRAYLSSVLKDPGSLRLRVDALKRGWYRSGPWSEHRFAWMVPCGVNARNGFGGYTGEEPWSFFFLNDRLVAIAERYGSRVIEIPPGGLTSDQAAAPGR